MLSLDFYESAKMREKAYLQLNGLYFHAASLSIMARKTKIPPAIARGGVRGSTLIYISNARNGGCRRRVRRLAGAQPVLSPAPLSAGGGASLSGAERNLPGHSLMVIFY